MRVERRQNVYFTATATEGERGGKLPLTLSANNSRDNRRESGLTRGKKHDVAFAKWRVTPTVNLAPPKEGRQIRSGFVSRAFLPPAWERNPSSDKKSSAP